MKKSVDFRFSRQRLLIKAGKMMDNITVHAARGAAKGASWLAQAAAKAAEKMDEKTK